MPFRKNSPSSLAFRPGSQPAPAQDQQSQLSHGESNVGDSSGPLFSMYSKAAEDEDNEMAERWQKDADGILIFVSPPCLHRSLCITTWKTTDRFILRCRCRTACCNSPEPDPQQSGYLRILPRKYLSGSRQPEFDTHTHLVPRR
jgi:hypothetical protein